MIKKTLELRKKLDLQKEILLKDFELKKKDNKVFIIILINLTLF